jgi:hypothetical protein
MKIIHPISVKQRVLVDPYVPFSVDLPKAVKIELPNKRLKTIVSEVLRKSFVFETVKI